MTLAQACLSRVWRAAGRYAHPFSLQRLAVTVSSRGREHFWGIDATRIWTTQTRNAHATDATARRYSHVRHSHRRHATERFSERHSLVRYLSNANRPPNEERATGISTQRKLVDKRRTETRYPTTRYRTYAGRNCVRPSTPSLTNCSLCVRVRGQLTVIFRPHKARNTADLRFFTLTAACAQRICR